MSSVFSLYSSLRSGEGNANVVSFRSVFQMTALKFSHAEEMPRETERVVLEECCKIEGPG